MKTAGAASGHRAITKHSFKFKNGTEILTLVIKKFKMEFLKSIIKKEFNYAGLKLEEGKGGGGVDILSFISFKDGTCLLKELCLLSYFGLTMAICFHHVSLKLGFLSLGKGLHHVSCG